jgi:hypothetical protein
MRHGRTIALSLGLWGAAACGPVESLIVIGDAKVAIEAAEAAGADQYAPFEHTAAINYLHKAREEMGYSEYEVAIDLAEIARKYAEDARVRTVQGRDPTGGGPAPPPPVDTGVEPPPRPDAIRGSASGRDD